MPTLSPSHANEPCRTTTTAPASPGSTPPFMVTPAEGKPLADACTLSTATAAGVETGSEGAEAVPFWELRGAAEEERVPSNKGSSSTGMAMASVLSSVGPA
eukprot:1154939-Pelagomonas_calceolata.AAC.16